MRSVSDHLAAVLDAARPVLQLDVVLVDADSRILAEPVVSLTDVPVRDVASRDGYAVRSEDLMDQVRFDEVAMSPGRRQGFGVAALVAYEVAASGGPCDASLSALAGADALAVVPEGVAAVRAGGPLACLVLER